MKQFIFLLNIIFFHFTCHSQSELWGMTSDGGEYGAGTIFKTDSLGNNYTIQHSFYKIEGAGWDATSLVEGSNGNLFGFCQGFLYEYNYGANSYQKRCNLTDTINGLLHDFPMVQAPNGKLYGVSSSGGLYSSGVIFEYDVSSHNYTKLFDFSSSSGASPSGSLLLANDGNFYGTTIAGGLYNKGVLYQFNPNTNVFIKKIDLSTTISGFNPAGTLVQASDGNLYGVTNSGGSNNFGTIYQYNLITNSISIKFSFSSTSGKTVSWGLTVANDGKLYGVSMYGGLNNYGTLFQYDINLDLFTKKIDFDNINSGSLHYGNLLQAPDGYLYGLSCEGGMNNYGIMYKYDFTTNNLIKLLDFDAQLHGKNPTRSLMLASNGKIYGICKIGGVTGYGTLFEFDIVSTSFVKKFEFSSGVMGKGPEGSALIKALDGKLYGTTTYGGIHEKGIIFQFDPLTQTVNKKYDFEQSTGALPYGPMTLASDGKFYGMTTGGGLNGAGVIYQYDPSTNIYVKKFDFNSTLHGNLTTGNLLSASDGNLYGMTEYGGVNNQGVLFQYNPITNVFTKKIDFSGNVTGGYPFGSLIQASDGDLYGMAHGGSVNSYGVIFKFNISSNSYTGVHQFYNLNDGGYPFGSLLQASDGNLYGMTAAGGTYSVGTLFQYNLSSNVYTKKIDFDNLSNGNRPYGALMETSNGNLYGVTAGIGVNVGGILFQYNYLNNSYVKKKEISGENQFLLYQPGALANTSKFTNLKKHTVDFGINVGTLDSVMCVNDVVSVPYSLIGAYTSGNVFTVELSDKFGSFSQLTTIGTLTANTNGTVNVVIPSVPPGNGYKIRIVSSSPYVIGNNTPINISISNSQPTVSIVASKDSLCFGETSVLNATGAISYSWNSGSSLNSIIVTPSITTTYSVIGINGCGMSIDSIRITTKNLPLLSVNNGTICTGQSFTIMPIGANSYSYSSGSAIVSPTSTVNYTVTGIGLNGCSDTVISTVNVYVLPSLTITGTNSVCLGTNANLTSTGAMTYTWNTGQISSSVSINPISSTIYTVLGTDINGCINTKTVMVTVNNTCADVWPGDANSDGLANNLDVLELGLHYTQTGVPRAAISSNWQSYFANNWTGVISNGKNLNHSDCNGDGTINDDDTLAIYNNYGLAHAFKPAQTNTVNSQLSIVPDQPIVVKGMWGTASVYLGDATTNITNINGAAFTVDFDNTLIEPNSIWLEYQNSFIDAGQNLYFRKLDFANNKLYTASTHTISNNVSGYGKIATLHYQILSSLATDEVLNIGISQANQSSISGMITPLTAGTGTLMAIGASVGIKESVLSGNMLISPNPTNGLVNITFNTISQNTKIELYNSIGALVLTEAMINKNNTINMSDLSNGMYFMKVLEGNKVITVKKVVKE